jgi:hypothetical protein
MDQVACQCCLHHPQGHEKSHWSHYDSWLWYHLQPAPTLWNKKLTLKVLPKQNW